MAESVNIKPQNLNTAGESVWTGYKNFRDITNMKPSDLAPGSRNTFIQDGDKLEPRAGMVYFGAPGVDVDNTDPYWCIAGRIHSKYDNFISIQGITVPMRVSYSGTLARGDIIDVWLPVDGDITNTNKAWFPITATAPATPLISSHRYYFDQWWDKDNFQSRTVFTFGDTNIWTWTGGFAPVVSLTGTTITTDATWESKGFIDAPEGNAVVVINEVEYTVVGGYSTNTINVGSTAGVSVGDLVFQSVDGNDTLGGTTTYDVCATLNNQLYYLDWKQRNEYISWNRNQAAYLSPAIFEGAGLDDATFSGTYTGTVNGSYVVTIDTTSKGSVKFTGSGANGLVFDTSGYTQNGTTNRYKVVVFKIPNTVQSLNNQVQYQLTGGPFLQGEIITGGTSGTAAGVIWDDQNGNLLTALIAAFFTPGETITGSISGNTAIVLSSGINPNSYRLFSYKVYKNDIEVIPATPQLTNPAGAPNPGPFDVADGIIFNIPESIIGTFGPTYTIDNFIFYNGSLQDGDTWEIDVTSGDSDTFSWSLNGVSQASNVPITGGAQLLSDGVSITFANLIGHSLGDKWTMTAYYEVIRGWTLFTYTQPNRLPGEGFTQLLDSNGWALKPQEDKMYTNAQAGHYYQTSIDLSADLLNETVTIKRLKSEPQNKVLFPYLLGYEKNQLAGISQDKTYDSLGRQELVELPQTKSISDEVRIDFETADWEDGDFLYAFRKMFFAVPRDNLMFIWDDYKQYWHSPMDFARRVGLISVVDGVLVGHSYEKRESYELFTSTNDLDDFPIHTRMVFPYDSFGKRYYQKSSSAIGFEGYVLGNPEIHWMVNGEVGGCSGKPTDIIDPKVCIPEDTASLGKSSLGFHGLGNDPVPVTPHFFFIDTFTKINYYQRNMEVWCDSMDQRWSLISIGTDVDLSTENNTTIVRRKTV